MTTTDGLRYIDSDGHILEHPTAMPDYAPAEYRDRVWHIETDEDGVEWLALQRHRHAVERVVARRHRGLPRRGGRAACRSGEMRYTEVRPAAYNAKARLAGHGHRRHRPRGAVPDVDARPAVDRRRGLRARAGARLQRLGVRPHPGGRGSPLRGGRGAADERRGRRAGRGRRDPPRRREAGHGRRCSCARTRRSTGGPSTTRSTTRCGRPRPRPVSCSRSTRSSCPTSRARAAACSSARPFATGSYAPSDAGARRRVGAGQHPLHARRSPTPST